VDTSLSAYTVEGGFDRDRLFHVLLLCFFLLKESKALGRIFLLQGFPYTTVRALVSRATRYRV